MTQKFEVQDAYEAVTGPIRVRAMPSYLEDQSLPEERYFFWAYTIEIENLGSEPVQLRSRYWRITDANGQVQEVRGIGVVGEEPRIEPGHTFTYTSGAPLPTASGIMQGSYQMLDSEGRMFDVEIPAFSLDSPHATSTRN